MLNFYRRFIPSAARSQALLNQYLKDNTKKKGTINWSEEANSAFCECKTSVANATLLVHPLENVPLSLTVDASDFANGAVIDQLEHGIWKPLGFYSKKLSPAQVKYSTYDSELLAVYSAIKYFQHFIESKRFNIYTDHKPLTFAFSQKPDKASPRQARSG